MEVLWSSLPSSASSPLPTPRQCLAAGQSLPLNSWTGGSVSVLGFSSKSLAFRTPSTRRRSLGVVRASVVVEKETQEAQTAFLVIGTRGR